MGISMISINYATNYATSSNEYQTKKWYFPWNVTDDGIFDFTYGTAQ